MPTDRTQTTIRFTPEISAKIAIIAKKEHRSMNSMVEYLVEKFIAQYERENGEVKIPEGWDDPK